MASCTRVRAAASATSSSWRWAAPTARRAAISSATSSVLNALGMLGSVRRQRRPSMVIQRSSSAKALSDAVEDETGQATDDGAVDADELEVGAQQQLEPV